MYKRIMFMSLLLFPPVLFMHGYPGRKSSDRASRPAVAARSMEDNLFNNTVCHFTQACVNGIASVTIVELHNENRNTGMLPPAGVDSIFSGGYGSGHSTSEVFARSLSVSDSMYNGSTGTGFDQEIAFLSLFTSDSLYNGGTGNGFYVYDLSNTLLYSIDSLYNGGKGRGESIAEQVLDLSSCGPLTIWTGAVSMVWEDPSNWDCGVVPGVNSAVLIPSGRPRYPVVNTSWEIRRLQLQPGGFIRVNTNVIFKINSQ